MDVGAGTAVSDVLGDSATCVAVLVGVAATARVALASWVSIPERQALRHTAASKKRQAAMGMLWFREGRRNMLVCLLRFGLRPRCKIMPASERSPRSRSVSSGSGKSRTAFGNCWQGRHLGFEISAPTTPNRATLRFPKNRRTLLKELNFPGGRGVFRIF